MKFINIGFGNMVSAGRIVAIAAPDSAPIKRLVQDARDDGRVIDVSCGRRTRAVIITDSEHVILSAIQAETITNRLATDEADDSEAEEEKTMIYPTIEQLTKGEFNRYELVVGVAKCARIVTDEYVEMRAKAQKMIDNHETDKPLSALIDPDYKDQKAVKIAIANLESGRFRMVHPEEK